MRALGLVVVAGCAAGVPFVVEQPRISATPVEAARDDAVDALLIADTHASNPWAAHKAIGNSTLLGEHLTHVALRPPQMDLWGSRVMARVIALEAKAKLVVHLGDAGNIACAQELAPLLETMAADKRPWVMTPGNHDSVFMGNFAGGLLSVPWARECTGRWVTGRDERMDKNVFLAAYAGAKGWPLPAMGTCDDRRLVGDRSQVERVRICMDAQAPYRSTILQQVAISPTAVLFLADTTDWSSTPDASHAGGTIGELGAAQLAALEAWIVDEQQRDAPRALYVGSHFPLDLLLEDSSRRLAALIAKYPIAAYLSAHTHDAATELRHGGFLEINLGSLLDAPMQYARASFARDRLTIEVVDAAAQMACDAKERIDKRENDYFYTAYVPAGIGANLHAFFCIGNGAYRALRSHMFERMRKVLGAAAPTLEAETSGPPITDERVLRYERCQATFASAPEATTRPGPDGKPTRWPASTRARALLPGTRAAWHWAMPVR